MYRTIGVRNRLLLLLIGLILILAAAAAGLISTGYRLPGLMLPAADTPVPALGDAPEELWVPLSVAAAGVVLGLLGLAWLIAQVPRRDGARPLRLHRDPATGITVVPPSAVTGAVEEQIGALPGVNDAKALLRGTAGAPELTVRVTADEDADIADIVQAIQGPVARDLGASLQTELQHLGVQVEVGGSHTSRSTVVL